MIASLPMYDLAEARCHTEALWRHLAGHLRHEGIADVPDHLSASENAPAHWRDPKLLLSQTCGYPLVYDLRDFVRPVAVPVYDVPGCGPGGAYASAIIVPAASPVRSITDLDGARAAINGADSLSGHLLLAASLERHPSPGRAIGEVAVSGAHVASMALVGDGLADVAAIDCVTLALVRRYRRDLGEGVRVIATSAPAPGLPLITTARRSGREVAAMRRALQRLAADAAAASTLKALFIAGFRNVSAARYKRVEALRRRTGLFPLVATPGTTAQGTTT